MAFADLFRKKKQPEPEAVEPLVATDSISRAERTASIVDAGIENGDFSGINSQLENMLPESKKTQYVFEPLPITRGIIKILVCGLFSCAFVYFLVILLGTLILSSEYRFLGIIGTGVSAAIILINCLQIGSAVKEIRFVRRYNKYLELLKYHTITITNDLASHAKAKLQLVIRDLNKAIKNALVPQGHFGTDSIIFIVSDESYEQYLENQAAYDRYYRKQIADRERMLERSEYIQNILDEGRHYIQRIHECNDLINDKTITQKLNEMEKIVTTIFNEVDINPDHAERLGLFIGYYLPTTEKLLEAYIDLSDKQYKGLSLLKTQKEIERSIDKLNKAFAALLDQLFEEQELDITGEITAMSEMMIQDGLVGLENEE